MPEILIPVGHDVGASYNEPDLDKPSSYDVQFGDGIFELSHEEYLLWQAAHGDLNEFSEGLQWSQAQTENLAGRIGVSDPVKALEQLSTAGLILRFDTSNQAAAMAFAGSHRTYASARGVGSLPDQPAIFAIEAEGRYVHVDPSTYFLWTFGHRSPNLWSGCVALTQQQNQQQNPIAPQELLAEFLGALPRLLAGDCMYIDRSV